MSVVIISNNDVKNDNCAMVNGINILSPKSVKSVDDLLSSTISKGIFIVDTLDKLIKDVLSPLKQKYSYFKHDVV